MTKEVGTLREIGARMGDIVELIALNVEEYQDDVGTHWTVNNNCDAENYSGEIVYAKNDKRIGRMWRIIRRASHPFNTLTAEEKGAFLLANHEGKIIEMSLDGVNWERSYTPQWIGSACYRVKADEVKEVVIYSMSDLTTWLDKEYGLDTHRITFNLVNGKPDCASVKMEEIK